LVLLLTFSYFAVAGGSQSNAKRFALPVTSYFSDLEAVNGPAMLANESDKA